MSGMHIGLDEAVDLTRTGDVWLFRGRTAADRAIQLATGSPVNHVGMSVVIEDLPPLMWHAELGRALPDLWSGKHQRGAQLHDLRKAVLVWATRYHQQAWLRQLDGPATREMEDAALAAIARLDGTPFPSTAKMATRWLRGRMPVVRREASEGDTARLAGRWLRGRVPVMRREAPEGDLEAAFCAEIVAITYQAMGLLPGGRRPSWYDPGRFWSGDDLDLATGFRLGGEIAVRIPSGSPAGNTGEARSSSETDRKRS